MREVPHKETQHPKPSAALMKRSWTTVWMAVGTDFQGPHFQMVCAVLVKGELPYLIWDRTHVKKDFFLDEFATHMLYYYPYE